MADPAANEPEAEREAIVPEITAALTELASRLERKGVTAKVYVHDGMMSTMTHRGGDTTATIDDALSEGTPLVEKLAAEIAVEQGLPDDWLTRLGDEATHLPRSHLATLRERAICIVVRIAARLATRCVTVARRPDASLLKKRVTLTGIRAAGFVVKLVRTIPSIGRSHRWMRSRH